MTLKETISWIPFEIKNRIFYSSNNLINVHFKDVNFFMEIIPDKDIHSLSRNLQAYKIREPMNTVHFKNWIKKEDILLDVGANLGYFTILGKKAKKIIAIEPLKRCIPILKKNLERNNIKNVEILNIALSKNGGNLYFEESKALNLSKPTKEKSSMIVNSKPLDYFTNKFNINAIKCDMEGYEYEVFGNGKIPEGINKIMMELHTGIIGEKKTLELIKNMYKNGFHIETFFEDIPLRMYPFIRFKHIYNFFFWKKYNLKLDETKHYLFDMGRRSVKYVYWRKK